MKNESVTAASASGDRKRQLIALRDKISRQIDNCESNRDLAALSRQFVDVTAQIEAIEKGAPSTGGATTPTSKADELAARREARKTGTTP